MVPMVAVLTFLPVAVVPKAAAVVLLVLAGVTAAEQAVTCITWNYVKSKHVEG